MSISSEYFNGLTDPCVPVTRVFLPDDSADSRFPQSAAACPNLDIHLSFDKPGTTAGHFSFPAVTFTPTVTPAANNLLSLPSLPAHGDEIRKYAVARLIFEKTTSPASRHTLSLYCGGRSDPAIGSVARHLIDA
ncbi:hypothetical protein [Paraburkholderia caffeinilytica]|uniref:hypothetical protein n=1 Tax=Paraburkholderia caffeinilytica TaxID=1761016 RepID=UPI0038B96C59